MTTKPKNLAPGHTALSNPILYREPAPRPAQAPGGDLALELLDWDVVAWPVRELEVGEPLVLLRVLRQATLADDVARAMRMPQGGLCAHFSKELDGWVVRKRHYRKLWRLLQRFWPRALLLSAGNTYTIDPTPGVACSMGLAVVRSWEASR